MPWGIADVDKHMKGLSDKQKKMWVQVANDSLARCEKKNGSNCDASAIRQANSVVGRASHSTADFCGLDDATPLQIEFSASEPLFSDDEYVLRSGLLFRAGRYEDKDFEMTADELTAAVEKFDNPVPIDLEHMPTILDGKLGEVLSISAFGDELHGVVKLPKWLDDAIGSVPRKVSATWTRIEKELVGLALCLDPRVEDAALMSAYAGFAAKRHDTPHGRMAMQEIHDSAARAGAVCKQPGDKAKHASRHESQAIQQVHDLTATHGAKCHALDPERERPLYSPYTLTEVDAAALAEGIQPGSSAGTPPPAAPRRETTFMSFVDAVKAWFNAGMPADFDPQTGAAGSTGSPPANPPAAPPAPAAPPTASDNAELARMRQERDEAQVELRRVRAERIVSEATSFAERMVSEGRAFPTEQNAIIAAYSQAATDDVNFGSVKMGDGTEITRTATIKAAYEGRPQHQLDMEKIAPQIRALLTVEAKTEKDPNEKPSEERLAELLGMTSVGQQILKDKNGVK